MHTYVKLGLVALGALIFVAEVARSNRPWGLSQEVPRYASVGTARGHAYILDTVTGIVTCCNVEECWELEEGFGPPYREPDPASEEPTALDMILGGETEE